MKKPILTIGIPTFNGASCILKSIESIIYQLTNETRSQVELLICDNASTDSTPEILSVLSKKYPKLVRVIHNNTNIGFDRNVNRIIKESRGDFIWPLADDDLIIEGGINTVLQIIRANTEISIVSVGGFISSFDEEYIVCKNGNHFFEITKFWNGGISSNIFLKSLWVEIGAEKYFDSNWIHFAMLIEMVARFNSIIVRKPLVSDLHNLPKRWGKNGTFILFHLELALIFSNMRHLGYKAKVSRSGIKTIHNMKYIKQIIKARAEGLEFSIKLLRKFVIAYYAFPSFWFLDLPAIFLIPKFFCKLIYINFGKYSRE